MATSTRLDPRALQLKSERALSGREGYVPLDRDEEAALARRSLRGDREATWALVMANQNFVRLICQRYVRDAVDTEDLVAEGLLGLVDAAERFDPDRGIKFITYGVWWVRRAVLRHLRNAGHPVHVPKYKEHEVLAFRRTLSRLEQELGHRPTLEEACAATGVDGSSVREYLALAAPPESIDAMSDVDGAFVDHGENPEEACIRGESLARMWAAMEGLPTREREILAARYELDDVDHATLAALGAGLGLTKERVRQVELGARRQLREAMDGTSARLPRPLRAGRGPRRRASRPLPCCA